MNKLCNNHEIGEIEDEEGALESCMSETIKILRRKQQKAHEKRSEQKKVQEGTEETLGNVLKPTTPEEKENKIKTRQASKRDRRNKHRIREQDEAAEHLENKKQQIENSKREEKREEGKEEGTAENERQRETRSRISQERNERDLQAQKREGERRSR